MAIEDDHLMEERAKRVENSPLPQPDPSAEDAPLPKSDEALFQGNFPVSQESLLKFQNLVATGMADFFNGISQGTTKSPQQDRNAREQQRAMLHMMIIQDASTRAYNETMDKLNEQMKDMDKAINEWMRGKEPLLRKKAQDWAKVQQYEDSTQDRLHRIKEACKDKSPEGEARAKREIQASIEENKDYREHLVRMRQDLAKEAEADEKFIIEHNHRKAEMISSFERAIGTISDKDLKNKMLDLAAELKKSPVDRQNVEKLKTDIEARAQQLPEGSKDLPKIQGILETGEKMGPLFWKVEEQLASRDLQNQHVNQLIQKVDTRLKLLEEAKHLSQDERLKLIEEILALEQETAEVLNEKKTTRDIVETIEKQRLKIAVEKANTAVEKDGINASSWIIDRLSWGQERTLANGEKAQVYQGSYNKLYYKIEDGKRVYLDEDDQFKLLNEDGYTPEKLQQYREARHIYAPSDTTPNLQTDFAKAGMTPEQTVRQPNVAAIPTPTVLG